jgi:hypothetical protein
MSVIYEDTNRWHWCFVKEAMFGNLSVYHEFHRQIPCKFSSITSEQNNIVALPTKGISGLYMTLILFGYLLINDLVHNIKLR